MVFSSGASFCRMSHHSSTRSSKRKYDNPSTDIIKKPRNKVIKTNFFNKDKINISEYKRKLYYYELISRDNISFHDESHRIIPVQKSNQQLLSDIFELDSNTSYVIKTINCSHDIGENSESKNIELSIFEDEDYDNPRRIYVGSSINSLYNCNIKIHGTDIKKFQLYAECDKDLTNISIYFEGDLMKD